MGGSLHESIRTIPLSRIIFVIMNQNSRQHTKTSIEKDLYKLMNNSKFGYDCINNTDNCFFVPVFDEIEELRQALSKCS